MKTQKITPNQTQQVIDLLNTTKLNALKIAEKCNVTYYQVHEVKKRYKLTKKQNKIFEINKVQEQIFLGGKIGDGNYKKNGTHNYYYRENHMENQKEYLLWKMNTLGNEIVSQKGIYEIKNGGFGKDLPNRYFEFQTITSPSLIKYATMSIEETIKNLDLLGLTIFILDDGWARKNNHLSISGGTLTYNQLLLVCDQFAKYGIDGVRITGKKRYDISIPTKHSYNIFLHIINFIPQNTDVIKAKFHKFVT